MEMKITTYTLTLHANVHSKYVEFEELMLQPPSFICARKKRCMHASIHINHIHFHYYNYIIGPPAYIIPGLDVDSSLAKQRRHLGVTLSSGYDIRSEPDLNETRKSHRALLDEELPRFCAYSIYARTVMHYCIQ